MILASFAILFMIPLSIILGVLGAKYADRPLDHWISVVTLVFVVGSILMLLLFDAFDPLPSVSLVPAGASPLLLLTDLAWTARLVWVGMHGVLRSDFIRSERLDGFPERRGDPEPGGSVAPFAADLDERARSITATTQTSSADQRAKRRGAKPAAPRASPPGWRRLARHQRRTTNRSAASCTCR